MIRYTTELLHEGEQSVTSVLFEKAWYEFPENQIRPVDQYIHDSLRMLSLSKRVEIIAYDDSAVVGGVGIGIDPFDPHVGMCSYIMHLYVLPEYRHGSVPMRLMRACAEVAKNLELPVLKTFKRLGDWQYMTHYRRLL